MNFAFGIMIGQLMGWMVRQIMRLWWIFAGLFAGSVVGQLLYWVNAPQTLVIPITWITAAFVIVYLRKLIKEKKEELCNRGRK